jgi:hypothetical protein
VKRCCRIVVVAGMDECNRVSLERVFGVDVAWRRLLDPSSCSGPVRRATDCACHPIQSAPTPAPAPARLIAPLHPPDVAPVESLVAASNMLTVLRPAFSFAGGTIRVVLSTS